MSRYVVVLPLEPLSAGDGFSVDDWPLHVTVVPNFSTTAVQADVIQAVRSVARRQSAVPVTIGEPALFGPDFTILVDVIANAPSIHRLHADLLVALELHADVVLDVPRFALAGYRPHVTVTSSARANAGERYTLGQLALVDMAPAGRSERRAVVATCELDHGDNSRLQ